MASFSSFIHADPFDFPMSLGDMDRYFNHRLNHIFGAGSDDDHPYFREQLFLKDLPEPLNNFACKRSQKDGGNGRGVNSKQQEVTALNAHCSNLAPILSRNFTGSFRLDIRETPENYTVVAELPGLQKENIQINLSPNNLLSIAAEREQETSEKNETMHLVERNYGKFARSVKLPGNANVENVDAVYDNGILTIKFAKRDLGQNNKRIEIK